MTQDSLSTASLAWWLRPGWFLASKEVLLSLPRPVFDPVGGVYDELKGGKRPGGGMWFGRGGMNGFWDEQPRASGGL